MQLVHIEFDFADTRKNTPHVSPQGINSNIDLSQVGQDGDSLLVNFVYLTTYLPDKSYIRMGGKALFSGPETEKAYEEWKKSRRISGSAGEYIVNMINYSASINAIFIARVFNLTPPIMPPTIRFQNPAPPRTSAPVSRPQASTKPAARQPGKPLKRTAVAKRK